MLQEDFLLTREESACYTESKVDLSSEAGWTPRLGRLLHSFLLLRGTGLLLNKHFCSGRSIRATTYSAQEGQQQSINKGCPRREQGSFAGSRAQLPARLLSFLI